ncbi:hypothetical protein KP509_38G012000 [Ceratopteris richardii]|uniref:C3H1-type domain-containing protein n=1 Tax=Ceratopteris richardii TaxID=49495 RepID=A0A8T2Q2G0_CERRI|nr:hypothetical protein KP509_38G012000 [Ceratopteris richardii]KAH7277859.1 hypothetical protein KP509_38G012000 [Ceratopteris richardii]KAH7277860.1 hypothetical protein KP509_38G012000 [Ceratopteris richardii]KAH7277861.1 hypothetical protein KP509_38G012000 [Ceratopteris richardii]
MEAPARVSRWSDGPSVQSSINAAQEADNGEKRAAATALEPPMKKPKMESVQTGDVASAFGGNSETLTGPNNSRSATLGHGGSSADQGYLVSSAFNVDRPHGSFAPGSARGSGTGALFFKTKLCTKFKLGTCTFNERCHFAHGVEELRKPPPGWEEMVKQGGGAFNVGTGGRNLEPPRRSNKPCRFYTEGNCPYGDRCTFSHGADDVHRDTVSSMDPSSAGNASGRSNYKTRLCSRWENGEMCIYGDKCHFAHGQAELRTFSGGPAYSNMGPTGPNMYTDGTMMNQPPLAAPYGAQSSYGNTGPLPPASSYGNPVGPPTSNYGNAGVPSSASNYGNTGVPLSTGSTNLNPYPAPGTNMNPYNQQDGSNGYSTNYTYWNPENKWAGTSSAPPAPAPALTPAMAPVPAPASVPPLAIPSQMYGQTNQAPWISNYAPDNGYPKTDNNPVPYYNQDPSQSQHSQSQNVPYYGGASTYQDPNSGANPPFIADGAQNGDGSAYYAPNYPPNQQQGYTATYNTV